MDHTTYARFEARCKIIKALAHPTRLIIVEALAGQEKCVCELTELVAADVSTVSRHLAVMKNAGIVRREKRGAQVYYSLRVPCILSFFDCIESVIKTNAEEQIGLLACDQ